MFSNENFLSVSLHTHFHDRFFYDFFSPEKQISEHDLKAIKKEMDSIIKADLPIIREEVSREEAKYVVLTITFTL